MRAREFITEAYSREKTWDNYGKKLIAYLTSDSNTDNHRLVTMANNGEDMSSELMDYIESIDPTPVNKFVPYISKLITSGGLSRLEDAGRLRDALANYFELSRRNKLQPDDKDLHKINSLSRLEDIKDKYAGVLDKADTATTEKADISKEMRKQADIEKFPTFTHIIPNTEESSKYYGKGTRWCTAANNHNMFNSYNNRGKLHILIPKKPGYVGEKYQLHAETESLMDEKDHPITYEELNSRHGDIGKFVHKLFIAGVEKQSHSDDPSERRKSASSKFITSDSINRLSTDDNKDVRYAIVHNHGTPELFERMYEDSYVNIRTVIAKNTLTPSYVLSKMTADDDLNVLTYVAININTPPDALLKLAENPSRYIKNAAIGNPNFPSAALTKLATLDDPMLNSGIATNPNTPASVLRTLYNKNKSYHFSLATNKATPPDILEKLARSDDHNSRFNVIFNPNTPFDAAKAVISKTKRRDRETIAQYPTISSDILDLLARDEDYAIRHRVIRHPKTSINTLKKLATDDEPYIRDAALSQLSRVAQ